VEKEEMDKYNAYDWRGDLDIQGTGSFFLFF